MRYTTFIDLCFIQALADVLWISDVIWMVLKIWLFCDRILKSFGSSYFLFQKHIFLPLFLETIGLNKTNVKT